MHAIPTTYAGVNFRSRLEARWAVMFDLLGWTWEYEPVDLNGYIPDFIIPNAVGFKRQRKEPLLIEVKPLLWTIDKEPEAITVAKKIDASGWMHHSALVGAKLITFDWDGVLTVQSLGLYRQHGYPGDRWVGFDEDIVEGSFRKFDAIAMWREAGNRVQWKRG